MHFKATNFSVTVLLLIAFTVAMMIVRQKRGLYNNWPPLYWVLVVAFTAIRQEETYNLSIVLVGLAASMLLRFEFMNDFLVKVIRVIEMIGFVYVIYQSLEIGFF